MRPNPWVLLETCVCYASVTKTIFIFKQICCRLVMTKKQNRALCSKFHK